MSVHRKNVIGTMAQLAAAAIFSAASFAFAAQPQAILLAQAGWGDPGAFMQGAQTSQYSRVGRLAVQLIQKGGLQEVPFDWVFHTNDEFRFSIATNKEGWLYILHRSPGGQIKILYPASDPATGQASGISRVTKNNNYLIPPPEEGKFVFDADTGGETFYIVIKDRPEPPSLNDVVLSDGQSPSQQQGTQWQRTYQPPTPVDQFVSTPQSAGGSQAQPQSQYQQPTNSGSQYPAQQQNAPGYQSQQQYQAQAQPQGMSGSPSQTQNQWAASAPPEQGQAGNSQRPGQQMQAMNLKALNFSVIPKAVKKLQETKYRGVSFRRTGQGNDPGIYFAPQPNSDLQDAWFIFKLNHVD